MGKTTLSKRIAWDWAKGNFAEISIVFFVLLKLVKPGDTIESVIIKQTPVLEGMHVTRDRLSGIFEKFGDRCLLILDGLDEHALGQNEDVHKIIRGAKCLNCNVFLIFCKKNSNFTWLYCERQLSAVVGKSICTLSILYIRESRTMSEFFQYTSEWL